MLSARTVFHLAAAGFLTILAAATQFRGFVWTERMEMAAQDTLMRVGRQASPNPKLVFLARDTASASLDATDLDHLFDLQSADPDSRRAVNLMTHEWPWPRDVYALVLDRLIAAGAKAVVFDFTFPKPSSQDETFRESLSRYKDRVVLAGNITDEFGGAALVFSAPTPALIAKTAERDNRIGFDNFWPDSDGVVRTAHYRWSVKHGVWESPEEFSLAARALQKAGVGSSIPKDQRAYPLRLAGPPGTFRPLPIYEIFVPKYWQSNFANGAFFKDKIVIVGASGNWQQDQHPTAQGIMTGAELQLNAMNAALQGEFLHDVPWWLSAAIYPLIGLLALSCCLVRKSPLLHLGLLVILGLSWAGAKYLLFNGPGIVIPAIGPLAILALTALFSVSFDLIALGAERLRLNRTIAERKRAEEILQSANEELERRVEARTMELSSANKSLTGLLEEKNVLLKEVHHRVKNNLQIISSLLNLQSDYIKDPAALEFFKESRNRVRSMALIHEKLYQSQDLAKIDFQDYIRTLTSGLQASFSGRNAQVRMAVEIDEIMLGVDCAVPCGLIVNELVTNCFKYAFGGKAGEIRISMKRSPEAQLHLLVSDNGVGFPKNIDFRNTESLGMQLVTGLTDQLEGTVELRNGVGTTFEIRFPEKNEVKP